MTYRHYITFIGMLFCLYFKMAAQSFCYEGKVVDEHHKPLSDVSVSFLRKNRSIVNFTFTDEEGRFSMTLDREKPFFLSLSFLGYANQILSIDAYTPGMTFQLIPSDFQLQENNILP